MATHTGSPACLQGAHMDGFYLIFIAVGFGIFWQSSRKGPRTTSLLMAWICLGMSLISAIALFGNGSESRTPAEAISIQAAFEALRHILLGIAVICLGFSFAIPQPAPNPNATTSDADAESLRNFAEPLPPDEQ